MKAPLRVLSKDTLEPGDEIDTAFGKGEVLKVDETGFSLLLKRKDESGERILLRDIEWREVNTFWTAEPSALSEGIPISAHASAKKTLYFQMHNSATWPAEGRVPLESLPEAAKPRDPYSFTRRDALDWLFVIIGMTVLNLLVAVPIVLFFWDVLPKL